MTSKILAAILSVCEIKDQKSDESRQAFLGRCVKEINGLADKDWEELPKTVQEWFNSAADVVDANKKASKPADLPDFPDLPKAEEASGGRRRGAKADDDGTAVKVGRFVKVVTKRGRETSGTVVEYDDKGVVLKLEDGSEKEFDADAIGTIEVHNDGAKPDDAGADEERGLRPGDQVTFETKRGKVVTGELVELTADNVVVKTDEGEDEFSLARLNGDIKRVGGGAAAEPAASGRGRSAAGKDGDAKAKGEKEPRVVNKGGVSVGQACKEILAADPDLDLEGVKAALRKRGIEFKDVTVEMNVTELTKFIKELRATKKLK